MTNITAKKVMINPNLLAESKQWVGQGISPAMVARSRRSSKPPDEDRLALLACQKTVSTAVAAAAVVSRGFADNWQTAIPDNGDLLPDLALQLDGKADGVDHADRDCRVVLRGIGRQPGDDGYLTISS